MSIGPRGAEEQQSAEQIQSQTTQESPQRGIPGKNCLAGLPITLESGSVKGQSILVEPSSFNALISQSSSALHEAIEGEASFDSHVLSPGFQDGVSTEQLFSNAGIFLTEDGQTQESVEVDNFGVPLTNATDDAHSSPSLGSAASSIDDIAMDFFADVEAAFNSIDATAVASEAKKQAIDKLHLASEKFQKAAHAIKNIAVLNPDKSIISASKCHANVLSQIPDTQLIKLTDEGFFAHKDSEYKKGDTITLDDGTVLECVGHLSDEDIAELKAAIATYVSLVEQLQLDTNENKKEDATTHNEVGKEKQSHVQQVTVKSTEKEVEKQVPAFSKSSTVSDAGKLTQEIAMMETATRARKAEDAKKERFYEKLETFLRKEILTEEIMKDELKRMILLKGAVNEDILKLHVFRQFPR